MKVTELDTEVFKPITIQITMESEKELIAVYNIFNHSGILNATQKTGFNVRPIYRVITDAVINRGLDDNFSEFNNELIKAIK